jgi:hypothetical protein
MIEGTLIRRKNRFDKNIYPTKKLWNFDWQVKRKRQFHQMSNKVSRENLASFVTPHSLDAQ